MKLYRKLSSWLHPVRADLASSSRSEVRDHFLRSQEERGRQRPRATVSKSPYRNVYALLLHWEEDDLGVAPEIRRLHMVLAYRFSFDIQEFSIPSLRPDDALISKLNSFISGKGKLDLLIIYYGGHAIRNPQTCDWAAYRARDPPQLRWNDVSTVLDSRSDVLLIFDCYFAPTTITRFTEGPGRYWALTATGRYNTAAGVQPFSFTNCLTQELRRLATRFQANGLPCTSKDLNSGLFINQQNLEVRPHHVRLTEYSCPPIDLTPLRASREYSGPRGRVHSEWRSRSQGRCRSRSRSNVRQHSAFSADDGRPIRPPSPFTSQNRSRSHSNVRRHSTFSTDNGRPIRPPSPFTGQYRSRSHSNVRRHSAFSTDNGRPIRPPSPFIGRRRRPSPYPNGATPPERPPTPFGTRIRRQSSSRETVNPDESMAQAHSRSRASSRTGRRSGEHGRQSHSRDRASMGEYRGRYRSQDRRYESESRRHHTSRHRRPASGRRR